MVARGGLVDEDALANALKNEEIIGAGIDVMSQETSTGGSSFICGASHYHHSSQCMGNS